MNCPIDCSKVRFAVAAVAEAAQLVRRVQQELVVDAITKDDKSPVTIADFAAQALIGRRLEETFPNMGFVGEESSEKLRTEEGRKTLKTITSMVQKCIEGATAEDVCRWIDRGTGEPTDNFWTLDPVDGTKGFLRGDQYAVALAYIRDGVVRVGALGCPELAEGARPEKGGCGSLLVARRTNGTFVRTLGDERAAWRQLRVSQCQEISQARLLRSVERTHTSIVGVRELVARLEITAEPVRMDSQAKYAVLASGGGEVNVRLLTSARPDYREKIWDQAAGSIIVEEAGGRVTDLDGKSLDFTQGRTLAKNRGILATNGLLHEAALNGLKQVGA
ncbi:MAG: 3'(2'),5'-bisphosphate nucleotidase [Planctomycetales bacterium]|nr:3'(2'),5'-bisphosphate nucleotidase [Planctomycetales bacterium]